MSVRLSRVPSVKNEEIVSCLAADKNDLRYQKLELSLVSEVYQLR